MPVMARVVSQRLDVMSLRAPLTAWVAYCSQCQSILSDGYPEPQQLDVDVNPPCPWCGVQQVELRDVTR